MSADLNVIINLYRKKMKQTPLILSIVSIIAVIAMAIFTFTSPGKDVASSEKSSSDTTLVTAKSGDIVYIQLDRVVSEYDKFNDLRTSLETKAQGLQNDIQRRSKQFENEVTDFQNKINKGLLIRSVAETKQQELMEKEKELNMYVGQKQQELMEEESVLNNTILEDIKVFLKKYNETHNYAMILTNTEATNVVILGNPSLDISDDVIKGLNEEYIKEKNK